VRRVGVRDSFFDLGGHSLLAVQMIDAIEGACGVRLPLTTLFTASTIEQLAEAIRAGVSPPPAPLEALNAAGTRPPLFFLHGDYYGGGLYCRGLAAALGPAQPFYAMHPHGLDGSDVPPSIEAMAADRIVALRRERARGPYFLGGHCNGALVAVEIARQLIEAGEDVPIVVVLDGVARAPLVEFFAGAPPDADRAHRRNRSASAREEGSRSIVDVVELYYRATRQYVPRRFPGRIAVLRSGGARDARPDLGWGSFAARLETHAIPGSHLASITRHVAATGARIKACLDAAYPPASTSP
jgi:thioesterase domain-containing protein